MAGNCSWKIPDRRAYENAIRDFMGFTGIGRPEEFRTITRAHIIAWRDELARRGLGGSTIRHRLASLASSNWRAR